MGQGDSTLIETPGGKTILIDGGRKSAGEKVVDYLNKAGVNSIDLMVATHPDADHIGGLIDVLEQIEVKKVLDSGKEHTTDTFFEYLGLIDEKNIPFDEAVEGQAIDLDSAIDIQVLNAKNTSSDLNESSIALKVSYGSVDFMLTGDASSENEADMVANYDVEAEILKAGHHGSNTSTSSSFVNEVSPEVGILSYGENNYGHPTDSVVNTLQNTGAELYSTYESGDIVITTNGSSYNVDGEPMVGDGSGGSDEGSTGIININTAGYEELQEITGVGPSIAQNIINYRNSVGDFQRIEDIMNVSGIAEGRFEEMKDEITI